MSDCAPLLADPEDAVQRVAMDVMALAPEKRPEAPSTVHSPHLEKVHQTVVTFPVRQGADNRRMLQKIVIDPDLDCPWLVYR